MRRFLQAALAALFVAASPTGAHAAETSPTPVGRKTENRVSYPVFPLKGNAEEMTKQVCSAYNPEHSDSCVRESAKLSCNQPFFDADIARSVVLCVAVDTQSEQASSKKPATLFPRFKPYAVLENSELSAQITKLKLELGESEERSAEYEGKVTRLREQLASALEHGNVLEGKIADLNSRVAELRAGKASMEKEIADLANKHRQTMLERDGARKRYEQIQQELAHARKARQKVAGKLEEAESMVALLRSEADGLDRELNATNDKLTEVRAKANELGGKLVQSRSAHEETQGILADTKEELEAAKDVINGQNGQIIALSNQLAHAKQAGSNLAEGLAWANSGADLLWSKLHRAHNQLAQYEELAQDLRQTIAWQADRLSLMEGWLTDQAIKVSELEGALEHTANRAGTAEQLLSVQEAHFGLLIATLKDERDGALRQYAVANTNERYWQHAALGFKAYREARATVAELGHNWRVRMIRQEANEQRARAEVAEASLEETREKLEETELARLKLVTLERQLRGEIETLRLNTVSRQKYEAALGRIKDLKAELKRIEEQPEVADATPESSETFEVIGSAEAATVVNAGIALETNSRVWVAQQPLPGWLERDLDEVTWAAHVWDMSHRTSWSSRQKSISALAKLMYGGSSTLLIVSLGFCFAAPQVRRLWAKV